MTAAAATGGQRPCCCAVCPWLPQARACLQAAARRSAVAAGMFPPGWCCTSGCGVDATGSPAAAAQHATDLAAPHTPAHTLTARLWCDVHRQRHRQPREVALHKGSVHDQVTLPPAANLAHQQLVLHAHAIGAAAQAAHAWQGQHSVLDTTAHGPACHSVAACSQHVHAQASAPRTVSTPAASLLAAGSLSLGGKLLCCQACPWRCCCWRCCRWRRVRTPAPSPALCAP